MSPKRCGTCHHSSPRSQEQQLLLFSLKLFYKPASINYHRPKLQALLIATSSRPFKQALFRITSCACPVNAGPLLTTSVSLPSHFSKKSPQNQEASTSPCLKTALKIRHKIFIAETSFWAAITLARLSAPPRALHRHRRVPCKLSEESRANYQTLLALLIAITDAALTTSAPLPSPSLQLSFNVNSCTFSCVPSHQKTLAHFIAAIEF